MIFSAVLRNRAATRYDEKSLGTLWLTIIFAICAAEYVSMFTHFGHIYDPFQIYYWCGCALMLGGIALRLRAIYELRRFFTVHVSIADDHELIRTGLYARLRHPSYTGALVAFLGLALTMRSWIGLFIIMIPIKIAFLRRIRIEEAVLREKFGERYDEYCRQTRALIPGVY